MSTTQPPRAAGEDGTGTTLPPSLHAALQVVLSLVRLGVRDVVLAPGSRSAPFVPVLAAAEEAGLVRVRVVVDERSAGFVALGIARAALVDDWRRPAAVITTSGTAVANLHPAVAEADAAGVPLLVISADRPHELVGTGANQTTEQTGVFGRAVRAVVDLPADLSADLGPDRAAAATGGQVRRAVEAARGWLTNDPGPAQVNIRFRPPLSLPADDDGEAAAFLQEALAAAAGQGAGRWGGTSTDHPLQAGGYQPRPARRSHGGGGPTERGIVVAGDSVDGVGPAARELAEHLGWPLLAEPTSGARGGAMALTRYAELLASEEGIRLAAQAEHVVVLGHPSLSRPVSALLARQDVPVDVVTSTARWTDVAGSAAWVSPTQAGTGPLCTGGAQGLARGLGLRPATRRWAEQWRQAVADLPALEPEDGLGAGSVALAVWESCLPRTGAGAGGGQTVPRLVVGSSMSIRLLDRLAPPATGRAPRAVANRGLAGIDGTLATATGVWHAWREPVRALVGDLTFLHDAMSLGRGLHEEEPDLQVVVVDTRGGAIFSTLEYPAVTPPEQMDRFFSTPQAEQVPGLARALGARVEEVGTVVRLQEVLRQPVQGVSVVHVRTA
ncbi:2-succinyl-5-enolpyruvyl-6-hydroxy-3-cyclohexene-1-carboxylic-acid synthase [Actinomyces faecalis]|uniref:2-succinyl-5-enolpyruvyl-6-hydroxy-3- cyclohexene-1-carboxylic-acid synthase n=1 Tax=Actinomyces faecalis TaxID=2722820 RepID=UPI001551B82C|nr:2-succinyl-5-enolpyruvyl-6-hydroxy-3-cyclohexene-1-carboxylic-acid synthase [Actinomyces faecalis]